MKVDIQIITEGEETAVIRCRQVTPAIKKIIEILDDRTGRLWGKTDEGTVSVSLNGILYLEAVDDRVFAYTDDWVLRIDGSLNTFTNELGDERFFRCSKSMIINVNRVIALKSLSSNRIDATMEGGEHIMISRRYTVDFRRLLKGDR